MATIAQRFEIGWEIRSMFIEFKDVVTVAILVWSRITAILADTTIALVDVLLQRYPEVDRHPRVPGEALTRNFSYCESCHALPYLAMPDPASPNPSAPSRALPSRTWSCQALTTKVSMPYLTLPSPTWPYLTLPDPALPHRATPCLAVPCPHHKDFHALPYQTLPRQTTPRPTALDPTLTTKVIYEPQIG